MQSANLRDPANIGIGMQMQQAYPDHQVFMFCGHIADDVPEKLKSGYAVADTANIAVAGMHECGFAITAISSLAEVREMLRILQLVSERDPEVDPTEYLDLYPANPPCYPEDKVFTFVGCYESGEQPQMGFAVAPSAEFVSTYLRSHHFYVHSITSLADLRETEHQLQEIAEGNEAADMSCYINFKS